MENAKAVLKKARKNYAKCREQRCADRRRRYELAEPKPNVKQQYTREVTAKLMSDKKSSKTLLQAFRTQHKSVASSMAAATSKRAASSITATRLVNKVLQVRKFLAGTLLRAVRSIQKMTICNKDDFGKGLHCAHSEPYFYESAYVFNARPKTITIDEDGQCRVAGEESTSNHTWKCSDKCKHLTESEVASIVGFRAAFDESMRDVRKLLDTGDECPNNRYTKIVLIS